MAKECSVAKDFKDFIMRGNVMDLAVGVIIGAAFGKIVTSLVNDILMPPIGKIVGNVDFSELFISLSTNQYPSLDAAKKAGVATINYGLFLNNVVNFIIIAFCIFVIVRQVNRFQKAKDAAPVAPTRQEQLLEEIRDELRAKKS